MKLIKHLVVLKYEAQGDLPKVREIYNNLELEILSRV